MKKFAKMSLVAAIAVAGLTSTATAGSLEEMIKNVDVSGKVYVEFLSNSDNTGGGSTANAEDFDFDVTFTSKVNDNVTSVVTLEADLAQDEGAVNADYALNVDKVQFIYAKNALTATAGRFGSTSPMTDGHKIDGANFTYNFANDISLYADYGVTNSVSTGDLTNIALMGSFAGINADVWYSNYSTATNAVSTTDATIRDYGTTTSFHAGTTVENIALDVRYSVTDYNTSGTQDGNTLKLTAGTTVSNVSLGATYIQTDKDGASATTDNASANNFEQSQLNLGSLSTKADLDLWALSASVPVGTVTYAIAYADLEADATSEEATELRLRATHAMSSNFTIMATYSIYEEEMAGAEVADNTSSRIDFKYTF